MKKNLLLFVSGVFIIGTSIGQNAIPNPSFDNWTNKGSYSDPNGGWGTIADISGGVVVNCTKATAAADIHSGAAAVILTTKNIPFQGEAPGIVVTGTINQSTMGVDGGIAFNLSPDSIVGWYKYSPVGTDTASVDVRLSYWNGSSRVQVAQARFEKTTAVSSYTRFSVPFVYSVTTHAPDTMVIVMMSSSGGATSANTNSTAYYDDLDLIYNSTTGIHEQYASSFVSVYPNPASEMINFSTEMNKFNLKVFDATGKEIVNVQSFASSYKMDATHLSKGIYFFHLISGEGEKSETGKFVIEK